MNEPVHYISIKTKPFEFIFSAERIEIFIYYITYKGNESLTFVFVIVSVFFTLTTIKKSICILRKHFLLSLIDRFFLVNKDTKDLLLARDDFIVNTQRRFYINNNNNHQPQKASTKQSRLMMDKAVHLTCAPTMFIRASSFN